MIFLKTPRNSLPIEVRDTDGYGKFKELVKARFS